MDAYAKKDDINQDLKTSAHNLTSEAVGAASETKNEFSALANNAGRRVRHLLDSASDDISHATDTITQEIRKNPVQSTLIALGAGFVLSLLFRR